MCNVTKFSPTFFSTPSRTRSRIAGTAVINVGFNIEASPFVPLFILFDVSVRVKGEPYPIEQPTAAITFCKIKIKLSNYSIEASLHRKCRKVA